MSRLLASVELLCIPSLRYQDKVSTIETVIMMVTSLRYQDKVSTIETVVMMVTSLRYQDKVSLQKYQFGEHLTD